MICATSFADSITAAAAKSREALSKIKFDDMYYRKDIGYEFQA